MNTTPLANSSNSSTSNSILHQASSALDQAGELTHRGAEAVRDGVNQVREKAHHMGDQAVSYIKEEPVKSVLIAAVAGATLMGLLRLVVRGAGRG